MFIIQTTPTETEFTRREHQPRPAGQPRKRNRKHLTLLMRQALLVALIFQALLPVTRAWDAGTESRRHSEGTDGENSITIFDTRPFWAKSTALTNSGRVADCPAGYTNTGLTCYRGPDTISNPSAVANCPAGYTNTGLTCYRGPDTYSKGCTTVFKKFPCREGYTDNGCFCGRGASSLGLDSMSCPPGYSRSGGRCYKACPTGYTNNGEFCGRGADSLGLSSMTCKSGETRLELSGGNIPRCYAPPLCPTGYEYWGLRCYIARPGAKRTAVSTVTMDVKQGGNTHLWIVNRALDLLKKSGDPDAVNMVALMNQSQIRTKWEDGLWDGDSTAYVDYPDNMGTHFYNGALKDWRGNPTQVSTYEVAEGSILPAGTGKLIFNNKMACKNARECADAQIATLKGGLNATNAYALGLALHYMTDVTQPMHSSGYDGFKIPNNLHPQYEYYAPFVQGKSPATNMTWDKRWAGLDPSAVLHESAVKAGGFAPRLSTALHISGDAGIVTIQGFNGIGPYTGYNFYNDPTVDALTGEILRDAYQSTASYLYSVYKKSQASR